MSTPGAVPGTATIMKTPRAAWTRKGLLLFVSVQLLLGSAALAAEPQVVTILTVDGEAAESAQGRLGTNTAVFRLLRSASTESTLRVHLTTFGEATPGTDYLRIPEVVEIPAGREGVEIVLTPLNDALPEASERAGLKILPGEAYRVGDRAEASAVIANASWESRPTVRLVSPEPYGNYRYPTNLVLRVEASGWDGQLGRIEFRAGTDVIGVREQAPFEWTWTNPPAGPHSLSVLASDRARAFETESPPVLVQVFLNNGLPMVSVLADDADASESGDPGAFLLWRADGHLEKPLSVQIAYGAADSYPIAINGTDYEVLPNPFTFPAGAAVKRLLVIPRPDDLLEGTEAVSAALALGDGYGVSSRSRAVVRIADTSVNQPAAIRLVTPIDGQAPVLVGTPIPLITVLEDPDHLPHQVTILADGRVLGRLEGVRERAALTNTFEFPGDFVLTAVAVDELGLTTTSAPVVLRVRLENSPPYVRIVSPERNAQLAGVRSLPVEVHAGDLEGTVRSVVFWVGTNRVGTVNQPVEGTTNVFRLGAANVSPGFQVLRAEAIDDDEALSSSAPVPIVNGWPSVSPPGIRLAEQPLSHSSFAIGARGVLFQWDFYHSGMLGQTNPIPAILPSGTGPIEHFASGVNGGEPIREGLALETDGEATRWFEPFLAPGRVPKPEGVRRWIQIAAGTARQFAIGDNGELYAWGNNGDGTLGLGPNAPESVYVLQPYIVPRPEGVRGWKQISATTHTLAIDTDGRLFAWGRNGSSQLGLGPETSTTVPVRTPTLVRAPGVTWKKVVVGASHSLGLTAEGTLLAWGNNESGQLGLGRLFPIVHSPQPVPLPPGATRWTALAAGSSHSLAATDDGSVYAWGANLYGQVRLLPDPPQPWPGEFVPRRVEWPVGVSEWLTFTGGAAHSLAVGDDGRVYRWGKTLPTDHHYALHAVPGATPEVLWDHANEPSFRRELPASYVPGATLTVLIEARPTADAAAWAVEDRPPAGWTVTQVSHDGVADPLKGKVKFGPFLDATPRTLHYEVRASITSTQPVEFAGTASVDGVSFPVIGDRVVVPGALHHPADQSPADFNLEMAEVTAYAAAWRLGTAWPVPPNPIPMDYLTRAGLLWRLGESYHFGGETGAPPLCWVPGPGPIRTDPGTLDFPAAGTAERLLPGSPQGQVMLTIAPQFGVSSYAAEEGLPAGATASQISHEGRFDLRAGCIRWGPFHDDLTRTVTYTLSLPAASNQVAMLAGRVSFDGQSVSVGGPNSIHPGANPGPWVGAERSTDGGVDLLIFAEAGQTCVIERSANAVRWEPVETLLLSARLHRVRVYAPGGEESRFFRVRLAGGR